MKTKIIMMSALMALLATSCGTEIDASIVRLFAEDMAGGTGTKVWVDPANLSASSVWIVGENVDINGENKTIAQDAETSDFVLSGLTTSTTRYAVYPGTTDEGNNTVTVVNNGVSGADITLSSLLINFTNGGHEIMFPMVAKATATEDVMNFSHLTAGFKMSLAASSDIVVSQLRVIVYGNDAADPVTINGIDYNVQWEGQGPIVPSGEVGTIADRDVTYGCNMYFVMKTDGSLGATISSTPTTFCIPVTVADVKRVTVIGYDDSFNELFSKTTTLNNVPVERNHMYPMPTIQIN